MALVTPDVSWTGSRRDWLRTRYAVLVAAFESIIAFDLALELALQVLALWAIETGWGRAEIRFNAGNVRRGSWQGNWYERNGREWRAYDSIEQAAANMIELLQGSRYGPATAAFLRHQDSAEWFRRMMDNATDGPGWHPLNDNESSLTEFLNALDRIPRYAA